MRNVTQVPHCYGRHNILVVHRGARSPLPLAHSRSASTSSLCEDPHQVDQEESVLKVSLDVVQGLGAVVPDPVAEPVGECLLLHFHPLLALSRDRCLLTLPTLHRVKHIRPAHTQTYVRTYMQQTLEHAADTGTCSRHWNMQQSMQDVHPHSVHIRII